MMKHIHLLALLLILFHYSQAQVDTITTENLKLKLTLPLGFRHTYVVYTTDSLAHTIAADLWDREIKTVKQNDGTHHLQFTWKGYLKDSLALEAQATCELPSMQPIEYVSWQKGLRRRVRYDHRIATVDGKSRKSRRDTTYQINVGLPAFVFPMDLEILPLLPFNQAGQEFAIPFYEPGSPKASYYKCVVMGQEVLFLAQGIAASCWKLKLIYSEKSYAFFWISDLSREVLKMQQPARNGYRFKVKLY
jgi:hypothetical protein